MMLGALQRCLSRAAVLRVRECVVKSTFYCYVYCHRPADAIANTLALSDKEKHAIFYGTAAAVYKLNVP